MPIQIWKKSYEQPRQHIKKQRRYFANKGLSSQSYGFSSTHVGLWELDNRKGWAPNNWFLRTVVLEKTLESPLDCKEFKPVNPKGNQHWIFIGRADAEVEAPILWPPDAKSWLTRKRPWCWERLKERRRGWQRMRWLDSITNSMGIIWANPGREWRTEEPGMLQSMGSQSWTWLSD